MTNRETVQALAAEAEFQKLIDQMHINGIIEDTKYVRKRATIEKAGMLTNEPYVLHVLMQDENIIYYKLLNVINDTSKGMGLISYDEFMFSLEAMIKTFNEHIEYKIKTFTHGK